MRSVKSIILLILFSWNTCLCNDYSNHKLPFNIKKCKAEFLLTNGDRMNGYVVDVTVNHVLLVLSKSEVEAAFLNDCKSCIKVNTDEINYVKIKKSVYNSIAAVTGIVTLTGILIASQDGGSRDGDPSKKTYMALGLIPIGIGISSVILGKRSKVKILKDLIDLKKHSTLYYFAKKRADSLRKFYKNPKGKTYKFYLNNFTLIIEGRCVSYEGGFISIQPNGKENIDKIITLNRNDVEYIK